MAEYDEWQDLQIFDGSSGSDLVGNCLNVEEINHIEPLDEQLGVYPIETVPNAIKKVLFNETIPTKAELVQYGDAAAVPPLKTYLVADVFHFPEWPHELDELTLRHQCLFSGNAEYQFSETAPFLIELDVENEFTRKLFTFVKDAHESMMIHHWHRPFGVFVRSRLGFEEVYSHLRRFTKLQDENGTWFFRRFWDTQHTYALLPLLISEVEIAGRFYGRTQDVSTARIHSYAVLMGKYHSLRIATWNEDGLASDSVAPKSRTQYLTPAYLSLLQRASERVSLMKVVDYLYNACINLRPHETVTRTKIEAFVSFVKADATRIDIASELGWTRVSMIALHLGRGFFDDSRFISRGLCREKIGNDRQAEKVFAIGNECIKQMKIIHQAMSCNAVIDGCDMPLNIGNTPWDIVQYGLNIIDQNADWYWGEKAMHDWKRAFLDRFKGRLVNPKTTYEQTILAYLYGLEFRTDASLPFWESLKDKTENEYAQTIDNFFLSEFAKDSHD